MIIVFVLMIISLLVSQSFMDLMSFMIILCSFWAWKQSMIWKRQTFQFHCMGLEKLWPAWIFVFTLGLALAPFSAKELAAHASPWLARLISLGELKWIINFYFFIWFFAWLKPWEQIEEDHLLKKTNPWAWIWGALLLFSTYGLIGLIFDYDLIKQQPLSDTGRVGGLFDDPMTFAHVYGLFFVFVFFVTLHRLTSKSRNLELQRNLTGTDCLMLVTSLACGLSVFLSMTRGIWIGIFLSLLVSLYLYRKKFGMIFLASSASLFTLLFLAWPRFHDRFLFAFSSASYDSERVWLWETNWKIFLDHPLVGIGYGIYKWRLREYYDLLGAPPNQFESHAHNQYLHFLAGTGLLGLLCFLFFVAFNLWQGWKLVALTRNTQLKGFAFGLFGAQICFLTAALTESNFERAKVRWTYLVIVALGISAVRVLSSSPQKN